MTRFVEPDHPEIIRFAADTTAGCTGERERASALYYAVRDGIRYDPYRISDDPAAYRASAVLSAGVAYCIPKAVLLVSAARAAGLTAKLGFADVRNHLQSEKLAERMGTDLFVWHGFVVFHLDGRWVKATPAFNIELCERFGVAPLDFDGTEDSLMHEFTTDGRAHMEYVADRGTYDDLPFEEIMTGIRATYGDLFTPPASPDEAFCPT